jgi:hypothetical protein
MGMGAILVLASGLLLADGVKVEIDGLSSNAPAAWKEKKPANEMQYKVFSLPKAEGDKDDATLTVFYFGPGGGGGVAENIKRWKGMFEAPAGKSIDDLAKVSEMMIGSVKVTYLDLTGTYLSKFPPFAPNAKITPMPDHRMLGVIFESPKGPYFIRVLGGAKTVAAHKDAFDAWLKNFK